MMRIKMLFVNVMQKSVQNQDCAKPTKLDVKNRISIKIMTFGIEWIEILVSRRIVDDVARS
jgi:hypothetical protein